MTANEIIKREELEDVLYDELKAALDNYASGGELKEYYRFSDGKLRYMAGFLIHNGWTLNRLKRCEDKLIQNYFELINRQKAEIEQLKFKNLALSQNRITMPERLEIVNNARDKAIREFATKLKQQVDFVHRPGGYHVLFDAIEVINVLVKEMTEE